MDILLKKYARRTTCLYEIVSKIVLARCSFRKADAKVVLLHIPTKQKHNFFPEFFVNKYNSLTTKEVRLIGTPLYIYAHEVLLCLGSNEFVTLAVDIDNLDGVIILEMLTEFGDVNSHTAGVEGVVINPY